MRDIHYLAFSGGGAAVYGYPEAIRRLEQNKDFSLSKIKAVAAASVGTIAGLLISLNYSTDEISKIVKNFDIKTISDGGRFYQRAYRLLTKYGTNTGANLYAFILKMIADKTGRSDPENVTFADMKAMGFKDLYIVTSKIYKANGNNDIKEKIFSIDKTPDTAVASAMLASCSAPGYFQNVRLKKQSKGKFVLDPEGDIFSDGGVVKNFPLNIFDQPKFIPQDELKNMTEVINSHTLGFALLNKNNINDHKHPVKKSVLANHSFMSFAGSIKKGITLEFSAQGLDKSYNRARTVQIDRLGIPLGKFDISDSEKFALMRSGARAVEDYLSYYGDKLYSPPATPTEVAFADKTVATGKLWDRSKVSKEHTDAELETLLAPVSLGNS